MNQTIAEQKNGMTHRHVQTFGNTVETITPDIASSYLRQNTNNRRINVAKVSRYAQDMTGGHWIFNGDTITFNIDGELIDGQHRLGAIIQSGVPCRMIVVRGVGRDAFITKDQGGRSRLDALRIDGIKDASAVASVTTAVCDYLASGECIEWIRKARKTVAGRSSMTPSEQVEFIRRNPDIVEAAHEAHRLSQGSPFTTKAIGVLVYLLNFSPQFIAFVQECAGGGGGIGSPSQAAYKVMMRSKAKEIARVDYDAEVRVLFGMFVKHLSGSDVTRLRISNMPPVTQKAIADLEKMMGVKA